MFFFLSKVLYYVVMPLTIVCACLVASWIIKNAKWKKRLAIGGTVLLLFFSNEFIANEMMLLWEYPVKPIDSLQKYKLAIVLTGATTERLPNDRVYFNRGADRVTHTVQLYKIGLVEKILISGGSGKILGESEPEANKFKKAMLMMGVNDADIIIENETRNTAESAIEVQKMLKQYGYADHDCVLITSAFHMRRSIACYRKVGLNIDNFPTDFYAYQRGYQIDSFVVPKIDSIIIWHKLVKEWVGFVAYKVAGYI